jgi:RNA polymerase sigma factor (sigma-70 family)
MTGFTVFAEANVERLRRTAYLLCRDWHLAQDLTQTTLTKVYLAWRRVDRDGDAFGYARKVLLRVHLDHVRRRSSTEYRMADLPELPGAGTDRELRLGMLAALGRLSVDDRTVLVLRYWEDLSEAETGRDLTVGLLSGVGGTAGVRPRRPRRCHRWRCPGRSGGLGSGRAG